MLVALATFFFSKNTFWHTYLCFGASSEFGGVVSGGEAKRYHLCVRTS